MLNISSDNHLQANSSSSVFNSSTSISSKSSIFCKRSEIFFFICPLMNMIFL